MVKNIIIIQYSISTLFEVTELNLVSLSEVENDKVI